MFVFSSFCFRYCHLRSRVISENDTWHQFFFFLGYIFINIYKLLFYFIDSHFYSRYFQADLCVWMWIAFFIAFWSWIRFFRLVSISGIFVLASAIYDWSRRVRRFSLFTYMSVYGCIQVSERVSNRQPFTLTNSNSVWAWLMKPRHGEYLEINITGNCTGKQI